AGAGGARRPLGARAPGGGDRAPARPHAAGPGGRGRPGGRERVPPRAGRRGAGPHGRRGRPAGRRARDVHGRDALRRPGVRAAGADRGTGRCRGPGGRPGGVPRHARAGLRLREARAGGRVRELSRRPRLPAPAADARARRPRGREPGRCAARRAPGVLRPARVRPDAHVRPGLPAGRRAGRRARDRRAARHDHRDPAGLGGHGRGERQPAPGEDLAVTSGALDPVLLEVIRNRLEAIADEMELTLLRSAASPIVKEGLDASAALFNVRGETIAQAAAIPIHLGCLELAAKRLVRAFPPDTMAEGDAFLLNDPYDGGTHLPDITLAAPIFAAGRPVALACTMCHHQDVGGRTPGSVPTDATELFQEGLIIPPTRLFRQGVLDENLFGVLRRNVRIPEVFTGDLMAQVAAGRLGGVRLGELFGRYGTAEVLAYVETLLDRAETLTRRGIAAIPDGTYAFQDWLDDDGIDRDRPVRIAVAVTVRGSTMTFDFTGTSPQVRGPFNAVPASTLSAAYYAVRAISDPAIPGNGGCFRALDVVLPPGSLVNPRPPAPVSCRTATIKRIADTILGALARALPE